MNESMIDVQQPVLEDPREQGLELASKDYYSSPYSPDIEAGIIKYQLETSNKLEELERFLRGEMYSKRLKGYVKVRRALMNDDGVNDFMSTLAPKASSIFILSNFSDTDVIRMALEYRRNLIFKVRSKWRQYNILKKDFDTLVEIFDHTYYAILKRSWKMATFKGIMGGTKHIDKGTDNYDQKNPIGEFKEVMNFIKGK